jgi:hypothetical protein
MAEKRRLQLILDGVDRITAPIRRVTDRLNRMNRPVRQLKRSFRDLAAASGLSNLTQSVGRLTAAMRNLALVGAAVSAGALLMMRRFIGLGDQVAKTAAAIDISSEALQEWRFAGDRMGVSQQEMDKGLMRFARTLGEVKLNTGALTTILKANAPALLKQFQAVKTTDEGMELLIDSLSRIENQNVKVALTQAAFGRGGIKLAKLLTAPREEIDRLRQRARDLGIVMSDETAAAAEVAQDRLTDFMAAAKGVGMTIAAAMLPEITALLGEMTQWVMQNRELITTNVIPFIKGMAVAIADIVKWMIPVVQRTKAFIETIGGLRSILIVVGGILAATLGPALVGLIGALLSPIGLVVAAITGLALAANLVMKHWDPVKAFFLDLFETITAPIRWVANLPGRIGRALGGIGVPGFNAETAAAGARQTSTISGQIGVRIASDQPAVVEDISASPGLGLDVDAGPNGLAFAG